MSWKLPTHLPTPQNPPSLLAWQTYGLSPRLALLAEAVPQGWRAVDVGTDHALLPQALVTSGRSPSAIAVDVSPEPLRQAHARLAGLSLLDRLDLRQGDGLEPLQRNEAEVLLMAGVSGETVAHVLKQPLSLSQLGLKRVVLQPNDKEPLLRQTLHHLGWQTRWERFVADGHRFFWTICAEFTGDESSRQLQKQLVEERFWTPAAAAQDPLLPAWLTIKQRWLDSIKGTPRPHPLYGADYVQRWRQKLMEID